MTYKGTNIFAQMITVFNRQEFAHIVRQYGGDRHAKGFTCWEQLVSMLFCHLGKAQSLREICGGLASCIGKLSHLRISKAPHRSTLSYANGHRDWRIYQGIFFDLLKKCYAIGCGKHKFRFKNKLFSMDATVIDLCLNLFEWAKFRQTKGAVKVHVLLDHDGYLPTFAHISDAKSHEVTVANNVIIQDYSFPKGSFVVFDRGYNDYSMFAHWCRSGIWFVTRQKANAKYRVIERYKVPANRSILSDELIRLTGFYSIENCPYELRRIEVWDEENSRIIVLLTNHLSFGSTTIADIYKDRWQIEIFFKTLKQHLKIKTFVGTTPNALKVQIWTALIAILLLKYLKAISTFNWSLSNLIAMLRFNLFTYRDLLEWLNNPFENQPFCPDDGQMVLPGLGLGQQQGGYSCV